MLGQLARKEQPDGGLDFPRSDGGPLVRPAHLKGSSLTAVDLGPLRKGTMPSV